METTLSQIEVQKLLSNTIGFNYEDITVNAQGNLTPRQCTKLTTRQQRWTYAAATSLGLGLVLTATLLATPLYAEVVAYRLDEAAIVLLLTLVLTAGSLWQRQRYLADLDARAVKIAEGTLELSYFARQGIHCPSWRHVVHGERQPVSTL